MQHEAHEAHEGSSDFFVMSFVFFVAFVLNLFLTHLSLGLASPGRTNQQLRIGAGLRHELLRSPVLIVPAIEVAR